MDLLTAIILILFICLVIFALLMFKPRHRYLSDIFGPAPDILHTKLLNNNNFREVLHTNKVQQVAMSIPVGGDIGWEKHDNITQYFAVIDGVGKYMFNSNNNEQTANISDIDNTSKWVVQPAVWHNIINSGDRPLKLLSIYFPHGIFATLPHPDKIIDKTKEDALSREGH